MMVYYYKMLKNKIKIQQQKIFHFLLKLIKKLKSWQKNLRKKKDQIKKMCMKVYSKIQLIEESIKMKFNKNFNEKNKIFK